jgi:hypothetical protein
MDDGTTSDATVYLVDRENKPVEAQRDIIVRVGVQSGPVTIGGENFLEGGSPIGGMLVIKKGTTHGSIDYTANELSGASCEIPQANRLDGLVCEFGEVA